MKGGAATLINFFGPMNPNDYSSPPMSSSASSDYDDDSSDVSVSRNSTTTARICAPPVRRQSCSALLRSALRNPDQLTAMISNYSTSYNAVNVGIALPVLNYSVDLLRSSRRPYSSPSSSSFASYDHSYRYSSWSSSSTTERALDGGGGDDNQNGVNEDEQDSLVASSLMAGMIIGQLIGGVLGDVLGRKTAMMLVMMLQIGGSLGSALFVSIDDDDYDDDADVGGGGGGGLTALEQLAIWRFVLGIGAGGV